MLPDVTVALTSPTIGGVLVTTTFALPVVTQGIVPCATVTSPVTIALTLPLMTLTLTSPPSMCTLPAMGIHGTSSIPLVPTSPTCTCTGSLKLLVTLIVPGMLTLPVMTMSLPPRLTGIGVDASFVITVLTAGLTSLL